MNNHTVLTSCTYSKERYMDKEKTDIESGEDSDRIKRK
jgi:hypothetical protein